MVSQWVALGRPPEEDVGMKLKRVTRDYVAGAQHGVGVRAKENTVGGWRRNLGVGFVAVAAAVIAMIVPLNSANANLPPAGGDSTLRNAIASLANKEYSNVDGHKYEKPLGGNCNFFSGALGVGSSVGDDGRTCATGYRAQQWCADFAKWVYKKSGASVADLNSLAYSAKNYATYQTVASGRKPRVGDLAVWATESHVGIVVAVDSSSGRPTVVSGNSWNSNRGDYTAIYKKLYYVSDFQGFAAPLYA
jgi:hypothetical protein